jgi:hypothetical protein
MRGEKIMGTYNLTSRQVALIHSLLLKNAMQYECASSDWQSMVRRDSRETYETLFKQHNSQKQEGLKTYSSYCENDFE